MHLSLSFFHILLYIYIFLRRADIRLNRRRLEKCEWQSDMNHYEDTSLSIQSMTSIQYNLFWLSCLSVYPCITFRLNMYVGEFCKTSVHTSGIIRQREWPIMISITMSSVIIMTYMTKTSSSACMAQTLIQTCQTWSNSNMMIIVYLYYIM